MTKALLLDVGGVVILTPFELLGPTERRLGLADGALGPRGPFGSDGDEEFARVRDGLLAEPEYWRRRAERAASLLGCEPTVRAFFRVLYDGGEDVVVRPEIRAVIRDAHGRGRPVGLLTNDLEDFHGREWIEDKEIFDGADALVDASRTGVRKPGREAFALALQALDVPAGEVVFVDDQPVNVAAAARLGMQAVLFEATDVAGSVEHVRSMLG